jgi:hypothetical protein
MTVRIAVAVVSFCLMLAPLTARADAQQDREACMMDAQIVCGQFIPDRERVAQCLIANRDKISPACREAIKRFK